MSQEIPMHAALLLDERNCHGGNCPCYMCDNPTPHAIRDAEKSLSHCPPTTAERPWVSAKCHFGAGINQRTYDSSLGAYQWAQMLTNDTVPKPSNAPLHVPGVEYSSDCGTHTPSQGNLAIRGDARGSMRAQVWHGHTSMERDIAYGLIGGPDASSLSLPTYVDGTMYDCEPTRWSNLTAHSVSHEPACGSSRLDQTVGNLRSSRAMARAKAKKVVLDTENNYRYAGALFSDTSRL